jgi:hypothetical protein
MQLAVAEALPANYTDPSVRKTAPLRMTAQGMTALFRELNDRDNVCHTRCHPERSRTMSEANRPTQSKDLLFAGATTSPAANPCHPESPRFASRAEGSHPPRLSRASLELLSLGRRLLCCSSPNACAPGGSLAMLEGEAQSKDPHELVLSPVVQVIFPVR